MLTLQSITVALTLLMLAEIRTLAAPAPVQVIYTGDEGCACPTKLGYQLNVPNPPKPKKYEGGDYGYRVEKPVQTKAKISYSFDFTVEQPRTPVPPKNKPSKLYAKVDRVAVHKSDCRAAQKSSCSCSSCSADKPRYVTPQINSSTKASTNAIRRRRDLSSHGSLLRKRLMRQQQLQSRPARYVKYYHKDLEMSPEQQHKMRLFGLLPAAAPEIAAKRKTKKATVLSAKHSKRWPGFGTRRKRDIKGEYDLLEQERAKMDLTAPEIIQFMPETLNPNFKRGQCHTGGGCCGAITASAPPPLETTETEARIRVSSTEQPNNDQSEAEQAETDVEQPSLVNSIPAKRSALSYYPEHQIPSPLAGSYNEYKFVDDSQLRSLLSTTSVPDPLEQSSTPLQFAGDLEAIHRRGIGSGYPVEHVADTQLDSIISGIVYQHPDYANPQSHYGGSLVDPEPVQKKQTTDFLKKLIDGRLGGWGFDTSTEPESAVRADYSTTPSKTYGFNTHSHNGYNVESYNVPPITDYLRAWF